MKNNIKKLLLLISVVIILVLAGPTLKSLINPQTVRAFGSLLVNFHVPTNTPIFNLLNIKPGDSQARSVDITNNDNKKQKIAVKGIKTNGLGNNPKLENSLTIIIKDGTTPVYGAGSSTGTKTLANFFSESLGGNSILLTDLNSHANKTYNLLVTFPTNAGNEYQSKSVVFDLVFGIENKDHLEIRKHYHKKHDSKDKKNKNNRDDEWVEIYNPTDHDISCNNWRFEDRSGRNLPIRDNQTIKSHQSALFYMNDDNWERHDQDNKISKTESRKSNDDRWDNRKNSFILKDSQGYESDRGSWDD